MKLVDADRVASDLLLLFKPDAERIEVAGSVRRRKPEVGDIELVAIPKWLRKGHQPVQATLGGSEVEAPMEEEHEVMHQVRACIRNGILRHAPPDTRGRKAPFGDRYMKVEDVATGTQIDVFCVVPPASWGMVFLIRTGSADYTREFVTRLHDKGMRSKDGHLERQVGEEWKTVDTPEERDVFREAGRPWVPPERRSEP